MRQKHVQILYDFASTLHLEYTNSQRQRRKQGCHWPVVDQVLPRESGLQHSRYREGQYLMMKVELHMQTRDPLRDQENVQGLVVMAAWPWERSHWIRGLVRVKMATCELCLFTITKNIIRPRLAFERHAHNSHMGAGARFGASRWTLMIYCTCLPPLARERAELYIPFSLLLWPHS